MMSRATPNTIGTSASTTPTPSVLMPPEVRVNNDVLTYSPPNILSGGNAHTLPLPTTHQILTVIIPPGETADLPAPIGTLTNDNTSPSQVMLWYDGTTWQQFTTTVTPPSNTPVLRNDADELTYSPPNIITAGNNYSLPTPVANEILTAIIPKGQSAVLPAPIGTLTNTDASAPQAVHFWHDGTQWRQFATVPGTTTIPNVRVHADATTIAAADPANPTLNDIQSFATNTNIVDALIYYTGTDTAADPITRVYFVDGATTVTQLARPSTVAKNDLVFITGNITLNGFVDDPGSDSNGVYYLIRASAASTAVLTFQPVATYVAAGIQRIRVACEDWALRESAVNVYETDGTELIYTPFALPVEGSGFIDFVVDPGHSSGPGFVVLT